MELDTYFWGDQHTNVAKVLLSKQMTTAIPLDNSIIQGNIGQIRPHLGNCEKIFQILNRIK